MPTQTSIIHKGPGMDKWSLAVKASQAQVKLRVNNTMQSDARPSPHW
jgi:hypothetical protein